MGESVGTGEGGEEECLEGWVYSSRELPFALTGCLDRRLLCSLRVKYSQSLDQCCQPESRRSSQRRFQLIWPPTPQLFLLMDVTLSRISR